MKTEKIINPFLLLFERQKIVNSTKLNNEKREGKKRQRSNKTTNEEKDLEKGFEIMNEIVNGRFLNRF